MLYGFLITENNDVSVFQEASKIDQAIWVGSITITS